jgi:hypothetical protein
VHGPFLPSWWPASRRPVNKSVSYMVCGDRGRGSETHTFLFLSARRGGTRYQRGLLMWVFMGRDANGKTMALDRRTVATYVSPYNLRQSGAKG